MENAVAGKSKTMYAFTGGEVLSVKSAGSKILSWLVRSCTLNSSSGEHESSMPRGGELSLDKNARWQMESSHLIGQ